MRGAGGIHPTKVKLEIEPRQCPTHIGTGSSRAIDVNAIYTVLSRYTRRAFTFWGQGDSPLAAGGFLLFSALCGAAHATVIFGI